MDYIKYYTFIHRLGPAGYPALSIKRSVEIISQEECRFLPYSFRGFLFESSQFNVMIVNESKYINDTDRVGLINLNKACEIYDKYDRSKYINYLCLGFMTFSIFSYFAIRRCKSVQGP